MILFQFLLISFAFFMMYVSRIHYRKKHLKQSEYFFWLATWIGFSLVVIWPAAFRGIAQTLRFSRVFDLLVILALMFMMLLTFYNRIMYYQLRDKLEMLVRERAIDSGKKKASA